MRGCPLRLHSCRFLGPGPDESVPDQDIPTIHYTRMSGYLFSDQTWEGRVPRLADQAGYPIFWTPGTINRSYDATLGVDDASFMHLPRLYQTGGGNGALLRVPRAAFIVMPLAASDPETFLDPIRDPLDNLGITVDGPLPDPSSRTYNVLNPLRMDSVFPFTSLDTVDEPDPATLGAILRYEVPVCARGFQGGEALFVDCREMADGYSRSGYILDTKINLAASVLNRFGPRFDRLRCVKFHNNFISSPTGTRVSAYRALAESVTSCDILVKGHDFDQVTEADDIVRLAIQELRAFWNF